MPRKREIPVREMIPDPIYRSALITKFVNCIMKRGKRRVAESTFYNALKKIENRTKQDPLQIFKQAIDNVKPTLEVKSRRVGGSTYQVPVEVPPRRRQSLAIRWILSNSRTRNEKTMSDRLANELIDAFNNRGASIKKKEDTHRMAEANKAFAHYRW
jgi:small subunit ribosomal protein S7